MTAVTSSKDGFRRLGSRAEPTPVLAKARERIVRIYLAGVRFSVVIPAHNEELLLPRGLAAIGKAKDASRGGVQVIVVANRCTDSTRSVAESAGATVVESPVRNIAEVRNVGARFASGEVLVTIDADSRMAPSALADIGRLLDTGRYVGGGTKVRPERSSAGIRATLAVVEVSTFLGGISGAMFWCRREDYWAIGGFDERLVLAEDIDFARRLRAHGKETGRKFTTLRSAPVTISMRKFDRFGDWHMFLMALQLRDIRASYRGHNTTWVDRYFFDYNE